MKSTTFAGLLASALHAQQAVATYSWGNAQQFSSPENCNNTCEGRQGGGWSFGDVPTTGNVGNFDGFGMSGFGCADSFGSSGGRRGLAKRFAQKALVGKATNDDASCPKISATDRDFSITQFHMSSDKEDQDVELHYDMPDGSVCKQKARCGTNAKQFDNSQCGGAKQVRVRGDCSVAFHSFNFDCNPAPPSTSPPVSTTTRPPTTTTSRPPVTTTASGCKENETPNTSGVCIPKTSSTTTASTTAPCKETETPNDKGSCVPKTTTPGTTSTPIITTPPVTTPATTPSTTAVSTTAPCKETETPDDKGSCVPKTSTTPVSSTSSACKETETPNDKGECTPKTTSSIVSTTSAGCKETETPNDKGECVPKTTTGPVTSATTAPITSATTSCGEGSTMDLGKSSCVSVPVTSGTTTPLTTTTSSCGTNSEFDSTRSICTVKTVTGGTGAPSSSSVLPTTSGCGEGSTLESGICKSTGVLTTTASSTSFVPTTTPLTSCASGSTMESGACKPTGGVTTPVSTTPVATTSAAPTCNGNEEFKDGKCVPKTPTGGLTSTTTSSSGTPSPPPTEAGCPQVLPRCIATWIQKAGCSSNSDTSCICPKKDLITNVQTCVEAWGGSATDIQAAYSFLVGLCAEFVPENPQICTGVPSTITLVPQPPPQTSVTGGTGAPAPTQPVNLPSTVITFTRTLSTTTLTQTVTVPQVSFNTITEQVPVTGGAAGPAGPTPGGVGLVPALPLTETAAAPGGSPPTQTPVAGQTGASTFVPSTTTGIPATKTGNSPINTFTGAASKPAYAVAAGLLGVVAFLA